MKFRGRVIEGQKLARTLGVPTANLFLKQKLALKNGVWLVRVRFDGNEYGGVLHAGVRQTDKKWAVEVHVLEFNGDLLGKILEVETIKFLRETMQFLSLSSLKLQIYQDVTLARKFFIREKICAQWRILSVDEREQLSIAAVERVSALSEFQEAHMIYAFAPDKQEMPFVQKLCSLFPKKQFAFPFVRGRDMRFYISHYEDMTVGNFKILEPSTENPASSPDLILVPAVAASMRGERLGRGAGYYDAFLSQNNASTVCVLPKWSVLEDIPFEAHDQRVGEVIGV